MNWIKSVLADPFWFSIILMALLIGAILTAVAYLILLERKIAAWVQDRYGPNRVGPHGLLQPLADGLKFLFKEDIIPDNVDKWLFVAAPWAIFVVATVGFAVIPWGGSFHWSWMPAGEKLSTQVASIDIGLLYILAVGSMSVYGVVLGGWASNNKYSFYGGMRAAAQMLSYEVPLGLSILAVILTAGTVRLEHMVEWQTSSAWIGWYHPLAAVLFFIASLAEANRTPFDLAECEQELIGGYHTEYSAMKLALFFLAEYAHIITSSALMVTMFFGGYLVPGFFPKAGWINGDESFIAMLCRVGVLSAKVIIIISLYMLIRWTIPRFRFDQLMRLAWKAMVPMGMAIVAIQAVIVYTGISQTWSTVGEIAIVVFAGLLGLRHRPVTGRQASLRTLEKGVAPI